MGLSTIGDNELDLISEEEDNHFHTEDFSEGDDLEDAFNDDPLDEDDDDEIDNEDAIMDEDASIDFFQEENNQNDDDDTEGEYV